MADHLTDEEQLQVLKNWWKENGASLVMALLLGLTVYFGFQWWQNYQQQQAEQASVIYADILELTEAPQNGHSSLSEEQKSTVNFLVEQLQNDYQNSLYAVNASFYAAKIAVENDDLDSAEQSLQWVIDHAEASMKPLAELRLARVLLAQEKYDDALSLLKKDETGSYISLNSEIKGDIFAAKEEWDSARSAYKEAINTLGDTSSYRARLLPIKLANLPAEEVK